VRPKVSLRQALDDPQLLGNCLPGASWKPWRTLLIASMGEPLDDEERELFKQLTGREREPLQCVEELVGVIGRRGGKSRAMATLSAYLTGLCDYRDVLAPGERGVLLCIAPDQRQASITLNYAAAAFEGSPLLRQLITNRTADTLELGDVAIEVRAASFRRLRGPTYIAIVADEAAFWPTEDSTNPDSEILGACRPGLATTRGLLAIISSPYARRGELWSAYERQYGPNGDPLILVAQGASRIFNPSLPQSVVDRAIERDESAARAEYLAEFRRDIESFVGIEAVRACVAAGIYERPPQRGAAYHGFVDPSGGSADSFAMAIGHKDWGRQAVVCDAVREIKPPFSPEAVVSEFASLLKSYGIDKVVGDRYAGMWPVEQFARFNIRYEQNAVPKSDLYRDLLPLINSGRVDLLDHPKLINQLVGLERRTARSGRDSIDHAPGGHDDLVNAVAGVAAVNNQYGSYNLNYKEWAY
jgi:hypothetical protein